MNYIHTHLYGLIKALSEILIRLVLFNSYRKYERHNENIGLRDFFNLRNL